MASTLISVGDYHQNTHINYQFKCERIMTLQDRKIPKIIMNRKYAIRMQDKAKNKKILKKNCLINFFIGILHARRQDFLLFFKFHAIFFLLNEV